MNPSYFAFKQVTMTKKITQSHEAAYWTLAKPKKFNKQTYFAAPFLEVVAVAVAVSSSVSDSSETSVSEYSSSEDFS